MLLVGVTPLMNQPSLSIWGRLVIMKARIVYRFVAVALKQSQQQLTFIGIA